MLEDFDNISILGFLRVSQMACHTTGIHVGATMWLFLFIIKKAPGATLNARACLSSSSCTRQEGKLTS